MYVSQILFAIVFIGAVGLFANKLREVIRNINLGRRPDSRSDRWRDRLEVMARVALGQSKMVTRPIAGALHVIIYVGFLVINLEVVEVVIDGFTGNHRTLGHIEWFTPIYTATIFGAELFMFLVLISTFAFLYRRNVMKIGRFEGVEMTSWPKIDANIILVTEIVLISALMVMNAADQTLMAREGHVMGAFPFSQIIAPLFANMTDAELHGWERAGWWLHILGILAFLNYIPYSKHFHIMMAFPNTYFSKLEPVGQFRNDTKVKGEVELMMSDNPYATPDAPAEEDANLPARFGAKDVFDLSWKNLMDSYTCTECGRCTSQCPANLTGKLLSPRKIMMNTRDRLEEVGQNINLNGQFVDDGRSLHDYISKEELWACTTCNACVEACPVNINPVSIIYEMRQFLVMEESQAPEAINAMFNNLQNNGAPWAMPAADRFNWANNITTSK